MVTGLAKLLDPIHCRDSTGSQADFFRMLDAKVEQGVAVTQRKQSSRLAQVSSSIQLK